VSVEIENGATPATAAGGSYGQRDFEVESQILGSRSARHPPGSCTRRRLLALVETPLPATFKTDELAACLAGARWLAQRIAYCWRRPAWLVRRQVRQCAHLRSAAKAGEPAAAR